MALVVVGLLVIDHQFGNERLLEAMSDQAAQFAYKLDGIFSQIARRIASCWRRFADPFFDAAQVRQSTINATSRRA
jgi:hypothetical protein